MRVLGIDPGTWKTGAAILEARGNRYHLIHAETIAIQKKKEKPFRLLTIYEALLVLIERYKPEVVALENVFYAKDIKATMSIGEARACAMLAATQKGIEIVEYLPTAVKKSASGNGRATKDQIQKMVKTLLGLKETLPPDTSDALAIAICHLHQHSSGRLEGAKPANENKNFAVNAGPKF